MLRAEVNGEACRGCVPCPARQVCKTRALMQIDAGDPVVIDAGRCRGCGDCIRACLFAAIGLSSPTYAAPGPD